jgi:hypothetical protein
VELVHDRHVFAHVVHPGGELADRVEHRRLLEVTQHVVSVADGLDVMQWPVKQWRQLVLLMARGQQGDDLIEVQVAEERRLLDAVDAVDVGIEQDAAKGGRRGHVRAARFASRATRRRRRTHTGTGEIWSGPCLQR